MRYEHHATRDGKLVAVRARILLDGGAYASSSTAVCSNAASLRLRALRRPERAHRRLRRLHRQPAVRGDARLRRRADVLRARGADGQARRRAGDGPGRAAAAQRDERPARRSRRARPCAARRRSRSCSTASSRCPSPRTRGGVPGRRSPTSPAARACGAASATPSATRTSATPRASTTTRPRACGSRSRGGEPLVEVHTAAAEVGQGLVTVQEQIARTELGVERVVVLPADTQRRHGRARPRPRARR